MGETVQDRGEAAGLMQPKLFLSVWAVYETSLEGEPLCSGLSPPPVYCSRKLEVHQK